MDDRYRAELKRVISVPRPMPADRRRTSLADCQLSCEAFVPRQPLVTLHWDAGAIDTVVLIPGGAPPQIRVDVAATSAGFEKGEFGTFRLRNVTKLDTTAMSADILRKVKDGQVLLNLVRDGRIVERSATLPVFVSPDAQLRALPALPAPIKTEVEADMRIGSIGQVRLLGQTTEMWRDKTQQTVSMVGLQPGLTYRFRVVVEQGDAGQTVAERICRVPVCPADFVDQP
ncbi:MAG: hypothetical protein AB2588_19400 [Candidatus Thiodiazotropha sp.]